MGCGAPSFTPAPQKYSKQRPPLLAPPCSSSALGSLFSKPVTLTRLQSRGGIALQSGFAQLATRRRFPCLTDVCVGLVSPPAGWALAVVLGVEAQWHRQHVGVFRTHTGQAAESCDISLNILYGEALFFSPLAF